MAAALTRPVGNRAVYLQIIPRPSSLGESREIMRLISQFGEVEYFKSLKYDAPASPNKALVIYKEEKAAHECIRRSPIRFRMGKVPIKPSATKETSTSSQDIRDRSFGRTHIRLRESSPALPVPPPRPIRMPFDPSPPADSAAQINDDGQLYQILSSQSSRNFRDIINAGHYHGGFTIDSKMPGQRDLEKNVPLPGLSCVDWKAKDKPWRVIALEKERWGGKGSLGRMAGLPPPLEKIDATDIKGANELSLSTISTTEEAYEKEPEAPQSAKDTLNSIMKGWESMVPGDSAGSSNADRYSGKRRRKWD